MKKLSLVFMFLMFVSSSAWALTTIGDGRKEVATAGTAVALSATSKDVTEVNICAELNNTGVIVIGSSAVIASLATRTGVPLEAGDCQTISLDRNRSINLTSIYIDSTVNTDGVTYNWIRQI